MADSYAASAFANNFMQGFSFVDQIKARNREEARLETRLAEEKESRAFQRERTRESDRQVRENRGFAAEERMQRKTDRGRVRTRELRAREANKVLALGPNAPTEQLMEYADFPEVSAVISQREAEQQDQADFEAVYGTGGTGNPAFAPDPEELAAEQEAQTQGGFGPALVPPVDEFAAVGRGRRQTDDELNVLADKNPVEAMRIRDEQNAAPRNAAGVPVTRGPSVEKAQERLRSEKQIVEGQWVSFTNINDTVGDQLRNLDPSVQAAKYWEDRSNLSEDTRKLADLRMGPVLDASNAQQMEIYTTAEPGSKEHRNAQRKLQKNFGLQSQINAGYSATGTAGVSGSGMPLDRNPTLTNNVVEATQSGPGTSLPRNPDAQRMDSTIVNRGTSKRWLTKRQTDAAYRMYKDGKLSLESYRAYLNTGSLPTGVKTDIVQRDPKQDTYIEIRDAGGNLVGSKLVSLGRDPDRVAGNVIQGDALAAISAVETAYNTTDYPTRGTDIKMAFISVLEQNEQAAINAGYDLSNVQDVTSLYQRFNELYVLRDAYNDEWFYNGELNPDFKTNTGGIASLLFGDDAEAIVGSGEFEDPRTGDTLTSLTPLKQGPQLTSTQIANIQANVPELAEASPEEIQAAYDAQQSGR